jgi:NADH-quinone oxidoreductase subunit J
MNGSAIIFYGLGALTLVSALLAVTAKKIFRAAIFLLFTLIGVAGIYFWLNYEFIAAVQIVVYVGGIVVMIIFSIFLTQQSGEKLPSPPTRRMVSALVATILGFALAGLQIWQHHFTGDGKIVIEPSVLNIGKRMLGTGDGGYALPFEVVSMLLLAAMIGCIVIAMRSNNKTT